MGEQTVFSTASCGLVSRVAKLPRHMANAEPCAGCLSSCSLVIIDIGCPLEDNTLPAPFVVDEVEAQATCGPASRVARLPNCQLQHLYAGEALSVGAFLHIAREGAEINLALQMPHLMRAPSPSISLSALFLPLLLLLHSLLLEAVACLID